VAKELPATNHESILCISGRLGYTQLHKLCMILRQEVFMQNSVRIGLLFNYTYSYYRKVMLGVREFAETRPNWVFMPVLPERRHIKWRGVDPPNGILATVNTPDLAKALTTWTEPIVNVSAIFDELNFPRVAVDNDLVGQLAAEHFLERGLKSFAFTGHSQHLYSVQREAAFCEAIETAGYSVSTYHTRRDYPFASETMRWYLDAHVYRWLKALPKPVGIFVPGDVWGEELTEICRQVELRVPEDVSIVGVDNDELYCNLARPPLSSIIVNPERIGFEAISLLDRLLRGEAPPSQPMRIPPLGVSVRRSSEVLAIDDDQVVTAARFIREHAHLPIAVPDVLKVVNISRCSLERRFRDALQIGLAEEICRVRLERCKHLLAETDLNMQAVAQHSGFSSARHLATAFRRQVGSTPSAYRKGMRARRDES
jgi:LacI family transcriptional regulator, galactose operon repressor